MVGALCSRTMLVLELSWCLEGFCSLMSLHVMRSAGQSAALCRHKHEIETGRTSSLSHHLLGYDAQDYVINYAGVAAPAPADIAADADKVGSWVRSCAQCCCCCCYHV